jgi:type II secretory ATPase GspE/PulE/Tfp pilus assembly ATPase PilB-like protein
MGLQPYLIADSLVGIVTQRLVRQICLNCKVEHKPQLTIIEKVKEYLPETYTFYHGKGCSKCEFTGYKGRIMICEILNITDTISTQISEEKNKHEIYQEALKGGFEPMVIDGIGKALESTTTLEEVLRVVRA